MNKLGIGITVGVLAGIGGFVAGVSAAPKAKEIVTTPASDVKWTPLDPKAGDKGPVMSVVFGDPKAKGPIGFLLKVPAGFKPGPHTHTSDDYAVIITGSMHDFAAGDVDKVDEGKALGPGSTWMQPGKQVHDNHCDGPDACEFFVYMPNGFDMKPYVPPPAKPAKPAK
jgi:Domain of unknown function (DUF4437)